MISHDFLVFSLLYDLLIGKQNLLMRKFFCGIFLELTISICRDDLPVRLTFERLTAVQSIAKHHITYTAVAKNILIECFDRKPVKLFR